MRSLKTVSIASAAVLLGSLSACSMSGEMDSSEAKTETRDVGKYESIDLKVPANVTVDVGKSGALIINSTEKTLPLITTKVEGGVLTIEASESLHNMKKLDITAPVDGLKSLIIEGAGKADVHKLVKGDLNISAKGAATVTLDGKADSLNATLEGAGNLNAGDLSVKKATISVEGAGSADVDAADELNASISGAGNIRYKGAPKLTQSIKGVGAITPLK